MSLTNIISGVFRKIFTKKIEDLIIKEEDWSSERTKKNEIHIHTTIMCWYIFPLECHPHERRIICCIQCWIPSPRHILCHLHVEWLWWKEDWHSLTSRTLDIENTHACTHTHILTLSHGLYTVVINLIELFPPEETYSRYFRFNIFSWYINNGLEGKLKGISKKASILISQNEPDVPIRNKKLNVWNDKKRSSKI